MSLFNSVGIQNGLTFDVSEFVCLIDFPNVNDESTQNASSSSVCRWPSGWECVQHHQRLDNSEEEEKRRYVCGICRHKVWPSSWTWQVFHERMPPTFRPIQDLRWINIESIDLYCRFEYNNNNLCDGGRYTINARTSPYTYVCRYVCRVIHICDLAWTEHATTLCGQIITYEHIVKKNQPNSVEGKRNRKGSSRTTGGNLVE